MILGLYACKSCNRYLSSNKTVLILLPIIFVIRAKIYQFYSRNIGIYVSMSLSLSLSLNNIIYIYIYIYNKPLHMSKIRHMVNF